MYLFKTKLFSRVYDHNLRFLGETIGNLGSRKKKTRFFVLIGRIPSISGDVTALR